MKIFDTSALIAIFDSGIPDLVDRILEMGHDLAVPSPVLKEIRSPNIWEWITDMIKRGKIVVLDSDPDMVGVMRSEVSGLGVGECSTILAYRKGSYCVLDDRRARKKASEMDVKYTGLVGLLFMLGERKIMSGDQVREAIDLLRKTGFYLPRSFGQRD